LLLFFILLHTINMKNSPFLKKERKYEPPIKMDKELDEYASEIFYLIKARNCAVACAKHVLIGE
jgi:hypothetical protein